MITFIKSRLNKDNLWNLVFGFAMTSGFVLTTWCDIRFLSFITVWSTILLIPFFIKQIQNVRFDKRYGFFNSNGKLLNSSHPKRVGFVLILTIVLIVFIGRILDKSYPEMSVLAASIIFISMFFLIPTMYFIYINCPISIMFNKNIWRITAAEVNDYTSHIQSNSPTLSEQITNPSYSHLPWNNLYKISHRK